MVQEIERLATQSGDRPHSIPLRQDAVREQDATTDAVHAPLLPPPKLPTRSRRWMRRRYRDLLAKIPALVAQPSNASNKGQPTPKYVVRRSSEEAYIQGQGQRRTTTSEEIEWIRRADKAAATMKVSLDLRHLRLSLGPFAELRQPKRRPPLGSKFHGPRLLSTNTHSSRQGRVDELAHASLCPPFSHPEFSASRV
jgi:hypothetical protein